MVSIMKNTIGDFEDISPQEILDFACELEDIKDDLSSTNEYEIEEPKSIWTLDGKTVLNLGTEILLYNNSGWLEKKYYAGQEINQIVLCDNLLGIIYNDKIEIISL